jgi:hypothetical protein
MWRQWHAITVNACSNGTLKEINRMSSSLGFRLAALVGPAPTLSMKFARFRFKSGQKRGCGPPAVDLGTTRGCYQILPRGLVRRTIPTERFDLGLLRI